MTQRHRRRGDCGGERDFASQATPIIVQALIIARLATFMHNDNFDAARSSDDVSRCKSRERATSRL